MNESELCIQIIEKKKKTCCHAGMENIPDVMLLNQNPFPSHIDIDRGGRHQMKCVDMISGVPNIERSKQNCTGKLQVNYPESNLIQF